MDEFMSAEGMDFVMHYLSRLYHLSRLQVSKLGFIVTDILY